MSVISFRARDSGAAWLGRLRTGKLTPEWYRVIDGLLAVFILAMLALMQVMIEREVVPYHLLFLGLTLVYGFRVWPLKPTLLVTLLVTVTTGWILVSHQLQDGTSRAEWAEIPLMPLLFLAMVWHARRRVAAQQQVELMAEERLAVFEREREFFRDASHAMRTPVSIAVGHLELLEPVLTHDPDSAVDYAVVVRQMDRLSALSTRLLALARLDSGRALRHLEVDLGDLLAGIGTNWSESADRDWRLDRPAAATITADADWLELAVDALIENAVHFTAPGDRIRLSGTISGPCYMIGVADAGPGIRAVDLPHVFERFWHRPPPSVVPMGSGLGLPMAQAAVRAHGGRIIVSDAAEGGALFEILLPLQPGGISAAG
ncbi:signal transduction histidine kinase [Kribbella sp. VKM Ac-2571]|uniref:sensor histidine kinase n=1 Tax=Kribbella sp. VKM Ac-2571 TaxID=2512222 RepID=UPI00105D4A8C|nr:HAMP domain-containing sensor histidine kinase [Kribbella sp. VKM Ac-2571]TDO48289.1 signal transduction histidine kinase [Kribbella sp. VKM Ac-2571]